MTNDSSVLGIGTVQWGMRYGVSNSGGATPLPEVSRILSEASIAGISVLDTAARYGNSEEVLGKHNLDGMRVVTKTPKFERGHTNAEKAKLLTSTFLRSIEKMNVDHVYGLLLHEVRDLLAPGGDILFKEMESLKAQGKVGRIGVSIYDSSELQAALNVCSPDLVQLPVNVLDQRLMQDGSISSLQNAGVEIHARSVFLQGLLLMPMNLIPEYFDPFLDNLGSWHAACEQQGVAPIEAALGYVRDTVGADVCLVGVQDYSQFQQCLSAFESERRFDAQLLGCSDTALLNPANWRFG